MDLKEFEKTVLGLTGGGFEVTITGKHRCKNIFLVTQDNCFSTIQDTYDEAYDDLIRQVKESLKWTKVPLSIRTDGEFVITFYARSEVPLHVTFDIIKDTTKQECIHSEGFNLRGNEHWDLIQMKFKINKGTYLALRTESKNDISIQGLEAFLSENFKKLKADKLVKHIIANEKSF
jgi:hypothetical protein